MVELVYIEILQSPHVPTPSFTLFTIFRYPVGLSFSLSVALLWCMGGWMTRHFLSSTGLNLEMLNLFWCRHFDTCSDLLFKRALLSAFKIYSFSSKQRLHHFAPIVYIATGFKISHWIVKILFFSLRSQMYLDSSV